MAYSHDLISAYQDALRNNPGLQMQANDLAVAKDQSRQAFGLLLPEAGVVARSNHGTIETDDLDLTLKDEQAGVLLEEKIFDYSHIKQWLSSKRAVKLASLQYQAAQQKLMIDVINRYLNVVLAHDLLLAAQAEKDALHSTYQQVSQSYRLGMEEKEAFYNAKAADASATSDVQQAQASLAIAKNALAATTGQYYTCVAPLEQERFIPLLIPLPDDIDDWAQKTLKQNLYIKAADQEAELARDQIAINRAKSLPTAAVAASYARSNSQNAAGLFFGKFSANVPINGHSTSKAVGVTVEMPLFAGGIIMNKVSEAEHKYQKALNNAEQIRNVEVLKTQQDFLNLVTDIKSVRAQQQSVMANQVAVNSARQALTVGEKTLLDYLDVEAKLYSARQQYATAINHYLNDMAALKADVNELNFQDISRANRWLIKDRCL